MRVELHGRRVGGWITELDPTSPQDLELRPLRRWSGHGPSAEVLGLCEWAAHHWFGAVPKLIRTASPRRNVYRLRPARVERYAGPADSWADDAFADGGSLVLVAPAADRWPVVVAALRLGNPLLLVPTVEAANQLAGRVRRAGLRAAVMPEDWDRAASGAVVIGTRAAAFAPVHQPGAIVVFDEHDEIWREERTPTWHARDVALERAERAGVPCVLVSPTPSIDALAAIRLHQPDRSAEHAGWPPVEVIDRRDEPPGRLGLFSEGLASRLDPPGRVACILNRTGRVRLLACSSCGELTRCDHCDGAVRQVDATVLTCGRCGETRPPVCANCGSARLKNVVLGIGRAREELSALIGEPVGERTASTVELPDARVMIGTEALLRDVVRREHRFVTIVFLDFDQHLSAPRQAAEAEAMALLALAARHVGARREGGRIVVQTRQPDHRVLRSALRADALTLARALAAQAERMNWPPTVAQAEVSGEGAQDFMQHLARPLGVTVLGPRDDRWQLRSIDRELLLRELGAVERTDERVRIELH